MNQADIHEEGRKLSKSFIALGILGAVLVGAALIPARWVGVKPPKSNYTPVDFSKIKTTEEFTKATDANKDGTLTWKELIGSTDEGAVIVADLQDTKPDPEIAKALADPNNLTASFSKNLLVTSTYLKNNNITDEETQKTIMEGLTQEEVAKTVSKKYSINEIKIAKTEDKNTIHTYGNEMGKILNNLITKKDIMADLPGVGSYLETSDEKNLEAIIADAKRVDAIVQKLFTVTVPPSATVYHLTVLNQIVEYRDTLNNLSKAISDPVRSAITVQKYPTVMKNTIRVYRQLSNYFNLKNIVFTEKESGYVFTIGFTLQ